MTQLLLVPFLPLPPPYHLHTRVVHFGDCSYCLSCLQVPCSSPHTTHARAFEHVHRSPAGWGRWSNGAQSSATCRPRCRHKLECQRLGCSRRVRRSSPGHVECDWNGGDRSRSRDANAGASTAIGVLRHSLPGRVDDGWRLDDQVDAWATLDVSHRSSPGRCSGKALRYNKPSLKIGELSRMCQPLAQGRDKSRQTTQSHWRVLQAYVLYSRTRRGNHNEE